MTAARGSVVYWIVERAFEDKERGRPVPDGLAALVQSLLNPDSSGTGTKPPTPATVEISTTEQAARMGCSDRYVRKLCHTGRLPARRVGRTWLISAQEDTHDGQDE